MLFFIFSEKEITGRDKAERRKERGRREDGGREERMGGG